MELKLYVDQLKKLYEIIINYVSDEENADNDFESWIFNYKHLFDQVVNNKKEFQLFLTTISIISMNHHQNSNFVIKIKDFIQYFSDKIKQTFTNIEIFKIFKNNKRVLLFLFEQKILIPDESVVDLIQTLYMDDYFLPEIEKFLSSAQILLILIFKFNPDVVQHYDKFEINRKKCENINFFYELIRNDSVEEFISYVNLNQISLNKTIEPSIFETNPYLVKNTPKLIEYAAFYGSLQIIRYLRYNQVELTPSLWIYAIHSNNAELIHFLEENNVNPPNNNYEICLKEAIKCHHNDIADYIIINIMDEKDINFNIENNFSDNIYHYCFKYHNYHFLPNRSYSKFSFLYLCKYNYITFVELYYKYKGADINLTIDQKSILE